MPERLTLLCALDLHFKLFVQAVSHNSSSQFQSLRLMESIDEFLAQHGVTKPNRDGAWLHEAHLIWEDLLGRDTVILDNKGDNGSVRVKVQIRREYECEYAPGITDIFIDEDFMCKRSFQFTYLGIERKKAERAGLVSPLPKKEEAKLRQLAGSQAANEDSQLVEDNEDSQLEGGLLQDAEDGDEDVGDSQQGSKKAKTS